MIKMRESSNWRVMVSVQQRFRDAAREGAQEMAEALVSDIHANWGNDGAAQIGSGNLDSAVMVNTRGRDESGRFASSETASVFFVTANAQDGDSYHGRGNYGPAIEYGRSATGNGAPAYAFLAPAMSRVADIYPTVMKRKLAK